MPFTWDCRLVFPGGYHAAYVLESFPCLGMVFGSETDIFYKGEGIPKINLEKFQSNMFLLLFQLYLEIHFFSFVKENVCTLCCKRAFMGDDVV